MDEDQTIDRRHTKRREEDIVIPWQRVWERAKWWLVFAAAGGSAIAGVGMADLYTWLKTQPGFENAEDI